ncbi:MAG: PepSY domain-containing protein [Gammaproteobacteria bacterium]
MSRSLLTMAALAGLLVAAISPEVAVAAFDTRAWQTVNLEAGSFSVMAEGRVSLNEAIRKVRNAYGDITILKAQTKGKVHQIKFLTDSGRVRTVRVDASSGEFI